MVDFMIKYRFKGILVISIKKGGDIMKKLANFKDWEKLMFPLTFLMGYLLFRERNYLLLSCYFCYI